MNGKIIKTSGTDTRVLSCTYEGGYISIEESLKNDVTSAIAQVSTVTCLPANNLVGGEYFMLYSSTDNYYVWFLKDGIGTNPTIANATGIQVSILTDETATSVATKVATAIPTGDFTVATSTSTVTITNKIAGPVKALLDGMIRTYFTFSVTTTGAKTYLYNGSIGNNVVEILDVIVNDDGSAEFLVLTDQSSTFMDGLNIGYDVSTLPSYIVTPANWLFTVGE